MAKPFRNQDGAVAGVVDVALDLAWLGQQLARLPVPPEAIASIADRNGIILARTPRRRALSASPSRPRTASPWKATRRGRPDDQPGRAPANRRLFAAGAGSRSGCASGSGWTRTSPSRRSAQANRTGLMLIVAGAVLALALTALLGPRLIRRPVNRLLGVADRWRAGDLAARTGLRDDGSEFGRLAAAFDAMAAALRGRERALRTALESTTDSVIVFDRAWRITYLNARAKAQIAQGRDLVGQVLWDAFPAPATASSPPATGRRWSAACRRSTRSATSAAFATWFEAHAYPSHDGLTVFFRDVTEERRIAAALRQSEELTSAPPSSRPRSAWRRLGLDGPGCGSTTGCARSPATPARSCSAALPGHHPSRRPGGRSGPHDGPARRRGRGATRWKSATCARMAASSGSTVTASLLRDAEGRPERFIGVIEDITARKRVEAALRESETRLQLAREAAGFGVWDWDLLTGTLIWSEEQWRLHGYAPRPEASRSRRSGSHSLHPDDRDRVMAEEAGAARRAARTYNSEYRVLRPDGEVRWLLVQGQGACATPTATRCAWSG